MMTALPFEAQWPSMQTRAGMPSGRGPQLSSGIGTGSMSGIGVWVGVGVVVGVVGVGVGVIVGVGMCVGRMGPPLNTLRRKVSGTCESIQQSKLLGSTLTLCAVAFCVWSVSRSSSLRWPNRYMTVAEGPSFVNPTRDRVYRGEGGVRHVT